MEFASLEAIFQCQPHTAGATTPSLLLKLVGEEHTTNS